MRELYLLNEGPDDLAWQARGSCVELDDPELFTHAGREAEAVAVCLRCPVMAECQAYAEEHDERFGIWGGIVRHLV